MIKYTIKIKQKYIFTDLLKEIFKAHLKKIHRYIFFDS